MTVKRNTFDIIATYELKTEVNIDNRSTDIGALESCSSAFLVKSLEKYMGGCLWNIWYTRAENLFCFLDFLSRTNDSSNNRGREETIYIPLYQLYSLKIFQTFLRVLHPI